MEALLEKEGKVENWNDDRLDELSRRMDGGFKEMRDGFARVDKEMKEGFAGVNDRIDKLFYLQILFLISLSVAVISHAV
jgi:hypothetical protein